MEIKIVNYVALAFGTIEKNNNPFLYFISGKLIKSLLLKYLE